MKNKSDYISRINRVVDYIECNIDREFTLDELAGVAFFSKYHFHRIFSSIMGETLFDFILRVRLEKAARALLDNQSANVSEIAYTCGFSSQSYFTRAFKKQFFVSPVKWRREKSNEVQYAGNQSKAEGKPGKDSAGHNVYVEYMKNNIIWRFTMDFQHQTVEVRDFEELTVAYVRNIGPYKGNAQLFNQLFTKLCSWAGARGLINDKSVFLTVYHDDPEITPEAKRRISVSVSVPPDTEVSGEIGRMTIPGGRYAFARFSLREDEFMDAWNWVYGVWLPKSGFQPDERACFELYTEEPRDGVFPVEICVPVVPV